MTKIRRRDLVRVLAATGAAAAAATSATPSSTEEAARKDKRRPQYQPNSPEVQTFYRVNRYPAK